MIYVTLGTMFLDFPRLVNKMDEIACDTQEEVIIQLGMAKNPPKHCRHFDFKSHEEILELQREARVVVGHAGIGITRDALQLQRPLILVPRLKKFHEHMNDHQIEIAQAIERRGWGKMVLNIDELPAACADPPAQRQNYRPAKEPLIAAVRDMVQRTAGG